MDLYIYNSLSRKKELFEPVQKGRVAMYVCGPTVYDYPHIGHAKSYISFDIVVRYLRYLGYKVRYVQNITDVGHLLDSGEDRILKGAQKEQVEPMELVEKYTRAYFAAMDELNVLRPDISPHAAAHIPEQIEFIKKLLAKKIAYEVKGSVYFDVNKWPEYGKLSGRKIEDQQAGARVEINTEKRHPADFALWKKAEQEHIMQWNSPWGQGYPGWHLECSTMSMKYLGETIDIHGGGMENQFPHHECEIAQSEALTGKPFVRYWMHHNMVLVDGVKMGKSLGNFTTIATALDKYSGEQIRFFILQSHYRSPVDFSGDAIEAAGQGLERLRATPSRLVEQQNHAPAGEMRPEIMATADGFRSKFMQEMNDDFNTPNAIGVLFNFNREINKLLQEEQLNKTECDYLLQTFHTLSGDILGIKLHTEQTNFSAAPFIEMLIELRKELREQKVWQLADSIRTNLLKNGIELKDGKEGTRWTIKN
ncbi:MAG TPA: cysteine--tRNA ligase [bacterium]|nr:cysteine--tRNA ligase [bacterium]HPN41895.1 cysteine--tRNA ligase [bacterium]